MSVEGADAAVALERAIRGRVIRPGDGDYDRARTIFYGGFDRRPAAIVRPADAADVSEVIRLAAETGLPLAVRSGGHSLAGHGVVEGGIVLDLGDLDGLEVDVEGRTAWAGPGLTTGAYTAAVAAHGLATGFGDTGSVGIGGITLAGGIGLLVRRHGLTIDSLLEAEVVTADGEIRRVDDERHPDLFWAIRGGGGNLGVATRLRFRLHELPSVVGGILVLPATPDTVAGFVALADAAPEELSAIANVLMAPPMPFLPDEAHGRPVIMAFLVHAGDEEAGLRAVAPFRGLAPPLADMVRPTTYPEVFPPEEGDSHPMGVVRTMFLDAVGPAEAATVLEHLEASTAPMRAAQIRVLGGAVARIPAEATAFAHRDRRIMVNVAALYERPEEEAIHRDWAGRFAGALRPRPGAYVAFLGDEGEGRTREAYPGPTWDRLAGVKARYDPGNLFRLNQNVPPAGDP